MRINAVREKLVQAIVHHDDGWAEWELAPRLDAELARPLSFLELPVGEAIEIWDRSIRSVEEIGELAAWIVAGHFSALLCTVGHRAGEKFSREWLREVATRRSQWFAKWHARDESRHTAELAGEALRWLQLFDLLSLWPCARYPVEGELAGLVPEPLRMPEPHGLVREIRCAAPPTPGRIVFDPWPFDEAEVPIEAAAHLVPQRRYTSSAELLASRVPFVAKWKLVPA